MAQFPQTALYIGDLRALGERDRGILDAAGISLAQARGAQVVDAQYAKVLLPAPIVVVENPDNSPDPLLLASLFVQQQIDPENRRHVIIHGRDGGADKFMAMVDDFSRRGFIRDDLSALISVTTTDQEFAASVKQGLDKIRSGQIKANPMPPAVSLDGGGAGQDVSRRVAQLVAGVNRQGATRMGGHPPDVLVGVMCSAQTNDPRDLESSRRLAQLIQQAFLESGVKGGLIFGASNVGKMKAISDEAVRLGMPVYGVETKELVALPSPGRKAAEQFDVEGAKKLDYLAIHPNIFSRMREIWEKNAYVFIDTGGVGTVQELMVYTTLNRAFPDQAKPIVVINENGHFDKTLAWLSEAGTAPGRDFQVAESKEEAVAGFKGFLLERKMAKSAKAEDEEEEDYVPNFGLS
ncbi:LOG family protein [Telmatospirillum siberiense]|uniref:AMP nucleosidase n=1 Tax=Telmatospirillum siberiense TaxID=382514 RepID=A0A2N3PNJ5_9PROT|nr:LOG family protein [Telmatospirillum siberiense]PKU21967.1 hypothetical protein CWS72_23985 [Telmatospirillum siberiense]